LPTNTRKKPNNKKIAHPKKIIKIFKKNNHVSNKNITNSPTEKYPDMEKQKEENPEKRMRKRDT